MTVRFSEQFVLTTAWVVFVRYNKARNKRLKIAVFLTDFDDLMRSLFFERKNIL